MYAAATESGAVTQKCAGSGGSGGGARFDRAVVPYDTAPPAPAEREWTMAESIELRTFTPIDILQPQTASFIATVAKGFLPLEGQAALLVEVAPGMSINNVTDAVLKQTKVIPGMQIVERAFGMLEVHATDQGQVRAAGDAVLRHYGLKATDRMKPRILTSQVITGIQGYHTQLINRVRHGDMILQGQTMLTLEVHPAGYALLATNEAEKAANIKVLELITFGAFGRLWLGGDEENIAQAAAAIAKVLDAIDGRENKSDRPV